MRSVVRLLPIFVVCSCAIVFGLTSIRADDTDAETAVVVKGKEADGQLVEILAKADELAAFGKEKKSPLALITAGGLYWSLQGSENKFQEKDLKPTVEFEEGAEKGAEPGKVKPEVLNFKKAANDLFDEARSVNGDLSGIEAIIKAVKAENGKKYVWGESDKERGSAIGPQMINRTLPPKATHSFRIPMVPGVMAAVGFRSSGPCKFTVVTPAKGVVVMDTTGTAANKVWVAHALGKKEKPPRMYIFRVHNTTNKPVTYRLMTN